MTILLVGCSVLLGHHYDSPTTNKALVLAVVTDPEPNNIRTILNSDGTIVNAYASRLIMANLLEMK